MSPTDEQVEAALKAFYPQASPGPWPRAAKDHMENALEAAALARPAEGDAVLRQALAEIIELKPEDMPHAIEHSMAAAIARAALSTSRPAQEEEGK